MSTGLTLNMYISTLAMGWFQQTISTKKHRKNTKILYLKKVFAKIAIFLIQMSESKKN